MEKLYIYGKLNKEEIIKQYTAGLGDGTANTIIDNQNNKISVQVVRVPKKLIIQDAEKVFGSFDGENEVIIDLSEYATDEDLSQLSNKVDTFDNAIQSVTEIATGQLFAYVTLEALGSDQNYLIFKNKHGIEIGRVELSPFIQQQSDWAQTNPTRETYIKNKPTKLSQFTNDGDGKGSPFITVADVDAKVDEKLKIIKTDGQGNKYLADDGEYKDIVTNRSLNPAWKIDGTTQQFIDSILADSAAVVGTSYLGGVKFIDLPEPLGNAECLVEILSSTLGSDIKVIHLDLYSATTSPYHWNTIYYTQLPDPIWQPDVTQASIDTKLDKTGGTISGNLSITGNLEVDGTTVTKDAETLLIKDNVIVTNSDKQTLLNLSGLAINKNSSETYGIMYDPTSDSVKLGLGSLDENNKFTFSESGNPVAVRSDSSLLVDGHLIKWDSNSYCFVDSGKSVDDFVVKSEIKQDYQIVKEEPTDKSIGKMIYEISSSGIIFNHSLDTYSKPEEFVNHIGSGTATEAEMKTYIYLVDESEKTAFYNLGKVDKLVNYTWSDPVILNFKIDGVSQSVELTYNASENIFTNSTFTIQPSNTIGETVWSDTSYFTLLYDFTNNTQIKSFSVESLKFADGAVIRYDSASFNINDLKIADGTQYKPLKDKINEGMQKELTAGSGITIENNIISATAQEIKTDNQTITLNANQEIQAVGVYNTSTANMLSANDLWLASSIKRRKK